MTKPTMERRHFELIATIIREYLPDVESEAIYYHRMLLAERFANELRLTNPSFNRARFLEACGVGA